MRELSFDPTELTPEDPSFFESNKLLLLLLEQKPNFIPSGKYTLKLFEEDVIVDLKYSLLKRPRARSEGQTRVEILIPEEMNHGGFSTLHKSLGVLIPEEDYKFKEKPFDKSRVCKIIPFSKDFDENKIKIESSYTKMNDLLHCKNPVFNENGGFIVMRHIRGQELYYLLDDVEKHKITLTILQRFKLTYAILKAYKEQVYDKGLIHRDIKPENIIVDLDTMTVTFLDFAFALNITGKEIECDWRGSVDFLAPETVMDHVVSPKSDIFSLGLTVAQIWNDCSSFFLNSFKPLPPYDEMVKYAYERQWVDLFKDIDLSAKMKYEIETSFDSLIEFNSFDRMDIESALIKWEQLINDFELDCTLAEIDYALGSDDTLDQSNQLKNLSVDEKKNGVYCDNIDINNHGAPELVEPRSVSI